MSKVRIDEVEPRELAPGYNARLVHTERTTHSYVDIDPHMPLPEHSHPHEQIVNMLEGTYELTVDGETFVLNAGEVLVIPGGAVHSGGAHTDCRILDVFSPVREEYR